MYLGAGRRFAFIYEDDIDDEYEICTCIQGMDDDTWRGYWSYLPYSQMLGMAGREGSP